VFGESDTIAAMETRWSAAQTEWLRELVMDCWDPIGVHHFARRDGTPRRSYWDEYDRYLPAIIGHLERGEGARPIQVELAQFRTKNMGLTPRPDLDAVAALRVDDWYRRGRPPLKGDVVDDVKMDSDAAQFFADRGFRLDFIEEQTVTRDHGHTYTWAHLIPDANPLAIVHRYGGGKDRQSAAAHSVTRWRVEQGE
jgi:hypothetical protein